MRRLFLTSFLFTAAISASASTISNWSAAYWIQPNKNPVAVVQYQVGSINAILGHQNWNLDVYTFAGAQTSNGALLGGFDIGKQFNFASNVKLFAGAGFGVVSGSKPLPGIILGASVQF